MKSNFNSIINSQTPVIIDFFATWCQPCKVLTPILKEVKEELGDNIKIIKIDVDQNEELARKQQIRGVPTLMLYKNGTLLWRQSGVPQKNELIQIIKSKI